MDDIIRVCDVSFGFDSDDGKKSVINNLNVYFKRGSFNVILGHNGSGKSTLAKLLNGLYKPESGTVFVNGIDTRDEKREFDVKKSVGLVFQNPDNQLVASVVEEDVAFGPENLGVNPAEIRRRVDDALETVGMSEYKKSSPGNLSGGQKQRVAIAGILAMEPDCIVLDEATSMLDPKGRREVLDTVYELNRKRGITIILITHFMGEAEKADRVIVMNDGKISADGTPKEIFSDLNLLKLNGLDVPQTTELLYKLRQNGVPVRTDIISVEATAKAVANIL